MVLYQMVAHFTMRTYGVNDLLKAFAYIETVTNIKSFSRKTFFPSHLRNKFGLPSYINNVVQGFFVTFLYEGRLF